MFENNLSRRDKIISLMEVIRYLKEEAIETAIKDYRETVLWSLAVDITTIGSVRWIRGGIGESFIAKHYRYIAPESEELMTKCRTIHEEMNNLFPNSPERYTARYIVMRYMINPDADTELLELLNLKYEVD